MSALDCDALGKITDAGLKQVATAVCAATTTADDAKTGLNAFFVLVSAYMVFAMQAGFAMLCAGSVRTKNTMNILLKNVIDAAAGAVAFYFFGWAFAWGNKSDAPGFIGSGDFALDGMTDYVSWMFQWAFAAAAATIVSGAMAERTAFSAYLVYSIALTGFVYPVVVHWVWHGQGWLSAFKSKERFLEGSGMMDFAGSGVVHMTGGFAALIGAAMVGPRMGRFNDEGKPNDMKGHSATLVVLGTFFLWFGWYGFNPGSMLVVDGAVNSMVVARAAVVTTLGGASAGVSVLFIQKAKTGAWDLVNACNGALAGLVSVTAGCSLITPWIGIIAGALGGGIFLFARWFVLNVLKIDDPVDAAALHGFCGMWGVLVVGLFAKEQYVSEVYGHTGDYGAFMGGEGRLLGCQIVGILAIMGWVSVTLGPLFYVMRVTGFLRATAEEESAGLDETEHGGSAYYFEHGNAKGVATPHIHHSNDKP